ncbi:MAG TPA: ABC transporter ATP-binding protein [Acidimicrobiales bacterium]|nr:ABC transporter ATP-binding protein [Acidimicrobiales bacterium]
MTTAEAPGESNIRPLSPLPGREPAVRAVDLVKTYGAGSTSVTALGGVNVTFDRGGFTAVMGSSGSGKSTLMHCLAGLDSVTAGRVWVGDTEVTALNDDGLTKLRRGRVGFVFQQFNLLPTLTAGENITLGLDIAHRRVDPQWFDEVVSAVGLGNRLSHRPAELSGGEQQRVACARALLGRPDVVFADEPTGNLDSRTSAEILDFLRRSVDDLGQTIVMVTHDPVSANRSDRVIFLSDGLVVADMTDPTVDNILERMHHLDAPQKEA